jgi:predicted lipid-binding transport protein (Tim44 family)
VRYARLRRQDGLIREAIWLFIIVAIIAIVVLDALALFHANQSVRSAATAAANEARNAYSQSPTLAAAKLAAQNYLAKNGDIFVGMTTSRALDGTIIFSVTAKTHADTYAFKYLRYVGLKKWVQQTSNPIVTRSSDNAQ